MLQNSFKNTDTITFFNNAQNDAFSTFQLLFESLIQVPSLILGVFVSFAMIALFLFEFVLSFRCLLKLIADVCYFTKDHSDGMLQARKICVQPAKTAKLCSLQQLLCLVCHFLGQQWAVQMDRLEVMLI